MTNEELISAYRSGNSAALEQLITQNRGLIAKLANKYMHVYKGGDYDDLTQEGALGLLRAVETYDATKGSFSGYAWFWIRRAMFRAIQGQEDTVSLDTLVTEDGDITLGDMLSDGSDFTEAVADNLTADNLWLEVRRRLTDAEFRVFALSVISDYSIAFIADKLGIPLEQAQDEKKRAFSKIRWSSRKLHILAQEWMQDNTPSYYSSINYTMPIGHSGYSGTSIVERAVIARDSLLAELIG